MLKFVKIFKKPLKATYDSYNQEVANVITPNFFRDLRVELTKSISPFVSVSCIRNSEPDYGQQTLKNLYQTFLSLHSKNSLFQFSFDNNKNYQIKSTSVYGPLMYKFQSIINKEKEVFSQLETGVSTKFSHFSMKLISPVSSFSIPIRSKKDDSQKSLEKIKNLQQNNEKIGDIVTNLIDSALNSTTFLKNAIDLSNFIYVFNYFVSVRNINLGVEVIGLDNELGISFASRAEKKNSVISANIQRFNVLTLGYFRKLLGFVELGIESKTSVNSLVKNINENYHKVKSKASQADSETKSTSQLANCITKTSLMMIRDLSIFKHSTLAYGCRIKGNKSEVKCTVSADKTFGFYWNESLTENLKVEFSSMFADDDLEYGIAMSYES